MKRVRETGTGEAGGCPEISESPASVADRVEVWISDYVWDDEGRVLRVLQFRYENCVSAQQLLDLGGPVVTVLKPNNLGR